MNVIFVDDEENVLKGLRRVLHPARKDWSMSFANSGKEALEQMKAEDFDVVISDMRMPQMNGVELLTQIKDLYPETLRVVLSGYSETELILSCVKVAHQYLPKPTDYKTIKSTVEKALRLKHLLANEALSTAISKLENLPSLPKIYDDINNELKKEDVNLQTISELISADVSMTAKLLQICNSAYFGLNRNIDSPVDAVNYLGIDTIKSLILTIKIFEQFSETGMPKEKLESIWLDSQSTAMLAKAIASKAGCDKSLINQAYTGGLLHNIGEIILRHELAEQYGNVEALCLNQGMTLIEAEQHVFGFSHDIVGAYLLDLWGLPSSISTSLALLHQEAHLNFDTMNSAELVFIAHKIVLIRKGQRDYQKTLLTYFEQETIDDWLLLADGQN
ncbi:response regulator [Pseudoteredinibacter isoporae]|uniref:response regulator n=1 Tax=Pseudoteredinibacter isoporae TaxID=570281 RepID=UPI003106243E